MLTTSINYPFTRTEDCVDFLAGLEFPDPYRWLESESAEVQQWQVAQNCLADTYVQAWPYYKKLKESVSKYLTNRISILPRHRGGQWFRQGTMEDKSGIIAADTPYGPGRLVYDIDSEHLETLPSISWFSPSPDGRLVALGICTDGSENNTIRLIQVATGECLANPPLQTLMDGWAGGARWLPDNSGFYFQALMGEPEKFQQQVLFHSIADGKQTRVELPQQDPESHEYILIMVSPDDRFHIAYQGLLEPHPIALLDSQQPTSEWQMFITEDCLLTGHVIGNQLVAVTNIQAPRGLVVSIPLEAATRSNPSSWTELIPESDAVIRSITPVGKLFYLSELVDTYSRVRIFDQNGGIVGVVPLPGKGSIDESLFPIMKLASTEHLEHFLFSFSTLSQSWGVYSHHSSGESLEILQVPKVTIDNAIIEDHWAISKDGTRIPYHSLRLVTTDNTKPQPTLIHAYGGYNSARPPTYPSAMAAFVAAGGIFILGNLRGGSEFGREWWQGGRRQHKQNSYQDLYAIAEDLIANNRTSTEQLAVNGGSNGGLMAGVAMTQRPKLWKAVVPQVPLLDLIGALRHPYGRYCVEIECADPENLEEVKNMVNYSAYHLIEHDAKYPAIFLNAGATDPRCPPWHARKFAARLQAANKSGKPVLLHVWENSGHGQATGRESLVLQYTEWLAFVMDQLEMKLY